MPRRRWWSLASIECDCRRWADCTLALPPVEKCSDRRSQPPAESRRLLKGSHNGVKGSVIHLLQNLVCSHSLRFAFSSFRRVIIVHTEGPLIIIIETNHMCTHEYDPNPEVPHLLCTYPRDGDSLYYLSWLQYGLYEHRPIGTSYVIYIRSPVAPFCQPPPAVFRITAEVPD